MVKTEHIINWDWFSTRTSNALKNAGITKVDQLARCSKEDLLRLENLGRKALNEIEFVLNNLGRRLSHTTANTQDIGNRLYEAEKYLETLRAVRLMYDREIAKTEDAVARLHRGEITEIPEIPVSNKVDLANYRFPYLTDRENQVVIARGAGRTMRDIATELGITPSRVRELEGAALIKLRHPRMNKLRPMIHKFGLCRKVFSHCLCGLTPQINNKFTPDTLLVDMPFSVAVHNRFKNNEVITLADLLTLNESDIIKLPQFTRRHLNHIKTVLQENGLSLAGRSNE